MNAALRFLARMALAVATLQLAACASTVVTLEPSPQAPVCTGDGSALVLWAPRWRPDQKDIAEREAAAERGLGSFFAGSGCFARAELRRVPDTGAASVAAQAAAAAGRHTTLVVITVRELGPVLRLLSSAALVEGGTEVRLQVSARALPGGRAPREFTVHWRHGGAGVVSGVAGLADDMQSALQAGLQPGREARK